MGGGGDCWCTVSLSSEPTLAAPSPCSSFLLLVLVQPSVCTVIPPLLAAFLSGTILVSEESTGPTIVAGYWCHSPNECLADELYLWPRQGCCHAMQTRKGIVFCVLLCRWELIKRRVEDCDRQDLSDHGEHCVAPESDRPIDMS